MDAENDEIMASDGYLSDQGEAAFEKNPEVVEKKIATPRKKNGKAGKAKNEKSQPSPYDNNVG
jgi:hypothetical protein